ncbi:alpha/beta hydrolase [Gordonia liuliyuniae]|uniref:Alpha/beta hydrolase n=1 Tax=Gordonia liuliyuniae TaxID=2911517 RepID=A0ABS9IXZ1_9ACTN|nr:alpha/beta hydrolase [Gordonia liuliyuniae]MCF8590429.1 alpha/beta hydrolase [Gordonia liuliyuniae]
MKQQDILLIHGTWGHGYEWDNFGSELTKRGYRVHAPSWRAHGHPREIDIWGTAEEVSQLGLLDFVDDFVHLVNTMDTPPIIVGHSAGGLLAQLVAARARHSGIALLAPAPGAGIFAFYPSALQLWGQFVPHWALGTPMYPVKKDKWEKYICNTTPHELSDQ